MPTAPPVHRPPSYKKREAWASNKGKSAQSRGYGSAWRKLRKIIIQRDRGLCQPCLKTGRVTAFKSIDHIISKAIGGTDAHSNLQCICKPCHDAKTGRENG